MLYMTDYIIPKVFIEKGTGSKYILLNKKKKYLNLPEDMDDQELLDHINKYVRIKKTKKTKQTKQIKQTKQLLKQGPNRLDPDTEAVLLEMRTVPLNSENDVLMPTPLSRPMVTMVGAGTRGSGLYTDEIVKVMSRVPSFIGCIASDQFNTLLDRIKPGARFGFISNLDDSKKSGSHWVAIVLNGSDKNPDPHSIMYYDPFGRDIPKGMQQSLKALADKIDPEMLMKLKINRVKHQSTSSDNCGWFSMDFLLDVLTRGKSFADASGFRDVIEDKSGKYEREIEELKRQPPFSYLFGSGISQYFQN